MYTSNQDHRHAVWEWKDKTEAIQLSVLIRTHIPLKKRRRWGKSSA
jgi:hypothetical protein